mgnify:CR=1 FL=1
MAVARDPLQKENLVWQFADTESTSVYASLKEQLIDLGYTVKAVTADGFSAIQSAFSGIPYQMCLVHMERLVVRGTTRHPLLEAGQVLLALTRSLHYTSKKVWNTRLNKYIEKYRDFLNEKTIHPITGERYWTHEDLRRALLSLMRYRNHLFTYTSNNNISKTTNSLEAHFSHLKDILGVHRGLSQTQKEKIINSILLASSIAPTQETLDETL